MSEKPVVNHFVRLKKLREHIVLLPGFKSYKDFDIAVEIGHHELLGTPLSLKQLLLRNIASSATVRRHLAKLIKTGLVVKHAAPSDHRTVIFTLSEKAHLVFEQCLAQLERLLIQSK